MKRPPKPSKIVVGGKDYPAVVALVVSKDPNGRPRDVRFFYDEESVGIAGGEEFLVVYAHGPSVARRN